MTSGPPTIAGRYRLEGRLGEGATGVVHRARQLGLDRPVALKLLHPHLATDPRARARFEREARVASSLDHPSAVRVHDHGEDQGRLFLVMELLEGSTLRALLDGGRLPLADVLALGWQMADVLAAAHRAGLVHRDLKPDNVFVDRRPDGRARARVVDFGLAFIAGDTRSDRMTVEGVVAGTPAYLSPEQARGVDVGPPTDVYALGCLLHEAISGAVPFAGPSMEVLARQMYAPPPPLRARDGAPLPTALAELVAVMLRKVPRERPDAAAVRDRLAVLDPTARERGRDDSFLAGRAARMVAPPPEGEAGAPAPRREVAVLGAVPAELLLGLAVEGLVAWVVNEEQPGTTGADAVFAPGAAVAEVRALVARGAPVVSDTDAGDMARITGLLRAGAAEVVVRPVCAEELSRRLWRAIRKHARARP